MLERTMKLIAAGLALAVACAPLAAWAQTPANPDTPAADHHLHIFSAQAAAAANLGCKKMGPKACLATEETLSSTGADALAALDAAGIQRGTLLSVGYMFGSPEIDDGSVDVTKAMRAENAYDVEQARLSCGRLVAFISVDPLLPNAVDEIDYWGRTGGATGLKLHLGNSDFHFDRPDQVRKLAAVFKAAERQHFAIVVHLRPRDPHGAADVKVFLRDVAPMAPDVPIQVAHAGAGGSVDPDMLAALGAFADAIAAHPEKTKNLYFDLAMVPDFFANRGKLRPPEPQRAALRDLMHRIGLNRFLLASDWTKPLNLGPYYANQKESLGLTETEWRQLASNVAPYFTAVSAPTSCSTEAKPG